MNTFFLCQVSEWSVHLLYRAFEPSPPSPPYVWQASKYSAPPYVSWEQSSTGRCSIGFLANTYPQYKVNIRKFIVFVVVLCLVAFPSCRSLVSICHALCGRTRVLDAWKLKKLLWNFFEDEWFARPIERHGADLTMVGIMRGLDNLVTFYFNVWTHFCTSMTLVLEKLHIGLFTVECN